jgi:hypothetical protein
MTFRCDLSAKTVNNCATVLRRALDMAERYPDGVANYVEFRFFGGLCT